MIKFKYFKTLATYNNNASTIGNDDIVFIQDDNTLRTHGKTYYFASSAAAGITSSDISNWNGKTSNTGTITSVGNTSSGAVTVSSSNNTASWGSAVTVGSVGGVDLKFTMPSNPGGPDGNTQYYMTVNGSVNGTSGSNNLGTIYAPTTAGTSGYYLKSNGSGAPTWAQFPTIPSNTNQLTNGAGFITLENTDSTAYSPSFDSESHTVHVTSQSLSASQKTQARTNIGAADASTAVNSSAIRNIVTISQTDYDALSSKDNNTLYIIT